MRVLSFIVLAQFLCTSVWFAGNGVAPDIVAALHLRPDFLAQLTSSVQFGFIAGTLVFALLNIADRFRPSRVFCCCSLLGALANTVLILSASPTVLIWSRLLTGFFLAGIYPVGMKIAADYFPRGLGKSLGFLVGALVAGTAFPQLLRAFPDMISWQQTVVLTSACSVTGGAIMLLIVGDGPYRQAAQRLQPTAMFSAFRQASFRSAAFGYFGHMWELYAFWAFVPALLRWYAQSRHVPLNVPLVSFCVIALGAVSCGVSGLLSLRLSAKRIAVAALAGSGGCCFLSPIVFAHASPALLVCFLFIWGMVVVADSPMFSSMVAGAAPAPIKGTALTIVTSIGFAITIVSIQLIQTLAAHSTIERHFWVLGIGPAFGLLALLRTRHARGI